MINVEIDITHECNFSCLGCDRLCNFKQKNPKSIMTLDDLRFIKNEIESYDGDNQISDLHIIGGEPTLNPYFHEIVDYVHSEFKWEKLGIFNNGTNKSEIDKVVQKYDDIYIQVNLFGLSKKDYHHNMNMNALEVDQDFSNTGCWLAQTCGLAISKYDGRIIFSPCSTSASMFIMLNRRNELFEKCDSLKKMMSNRDWIFGEVCKYCHHRLWPNKCVMFSEEDWKNGKGYVSEIFKKGIEEYQMS